MILETVKSEGIAHKSYFIGSNGIAAVVDPRRDCDIYIDIAEKNNMRINYIFETHRNEDYTAGSLELREVVGADIFHGKGLDFAYGNSVVEGDKFQIGNVVLEIIETPGHTNESISLLLKDREVSEYPYMVFTGDTIFAGEVGRCDLYGNNETLKMAKAMYNSVFNKLLKLDDNVIILPAHGSGSVCGAVIREQEFTTVGYEKKTNPALKKSEKEFLEFKLHEKLYTPPYFKEMEKNNLIGPSLICKLPYLKPLGIHELKELMSKGGQVVDVRDPAAFAGGHIPNTLNIWKDGLPSYSGWFLNYEQPIIVVDENNSNIEDLKRYLIRLGYDNVYGYLSGGFPVWFKGSGDFETVHTWSVHDLLPNMGKKSLFILDVRKENDWEKERIEGSHNIYIGELKENLDKVPRNKHVAVLCDTGYKASIGTSILKMNGYKNVTNVMGSMTAWKKAGYPVVKR
ncbi:beta-lactamase domain protein [Methanobacterium lacus]|uniref:Beta-lactamase domain protein n=1 Tax=Methanobacterium lacus (strain AL-21) TaxID=877455 RepID=F0T9F8_METLA|nr:MBL fold metallo-hydrolase [Methanobacterium lacus]ADZ08706.1 beta-lactamase domain protein [Methanobacterium lacus]